MKIINLENEENKYITWVKDALSEMLDNNTKDEIKSKVKDTCIYYIILAIASFLCGYMMMGFFGYLKKKICKIFEDKDVQNEVHKTL